MIDKTELAKVVAAFKYDWTSGNVDWLPGEIYKLKAIKTFQDNWNLEASDFSDMLKRSLKDTENLLASAMYFPQGMILIFAGEFPEEVRGMFRTLFDESADVAERIAAFKQQSEGLLVRHFKGPTNRGHYQDEKAITTYLWLRYPNKYYIYKPSIAKTVAPALKANYQFISSEKHQADNIRNFFAMYDEICAELKKDTELIKLTRSNLSEEYYPDPEVKTLTTDIGFYIERVYLKHPQSVPTPIPEPSSVQPMPAKNYWFLSSNPKIWSIAAIPVGEKQYYTLYNDSGNKRRIFQNFLDAKVGDLVIGYESTPVKQIVALARVCAEQDGEKLWFEKTENLATPIDFSALKNAPEMADSEFFKMQRGTLFRLTTDEYDFLLDLIREENPEPAPAVSEPVSVYDKKAFLSDVFMTEQRYDALAAVLKRKKNIILQGAPGVGKTFAARRLAWSMMGEQDDSRIEFVQFHQNYSYEDFVMGYKPVEDGFKLKYGVFYRFCQKASNQPDQDFFFIIDEINRGNMSKIFGELLMLIEKDYRGKPLTLAYDGRAFSVPENLHIIGMMNTADRSLAMIDYALRRRFSFFEMEPGFDSDGFRAYQNGLNNDTLNRLIEKVKPLNEEIAKDRSLGKGFCIGHSYFCGQDTCTDEWLHAVVDYDILPMLEEYWFDDDGKYQQWKKELQGVFHDEA